MALSLENVLLSAADGLVQSGDQIWFHFDKYPWHLSKPDRNPNIGEHQHRIETRISKGLPDPLGAKPLYGTYYLGISPHIYSYYHLITDLLVNLIGVKKYPILVPKFMPISYINFLRNIGFQVKILPPKIFFIEKLLIPKTNKPDWNKTKVKKIQYFFDYLLYQSIPQISQEFEYNKKIYVSRELAIKRHLSNESEFLPILKKYNFTKIFLERLSIPDQIKLFSKVSHVIAPHGAGLINVLFASTQIKILEIRPLLTSGQFCFENLFSLGWPNYDFIVPPQTGKFYLPVDQLEKILIRWDNQEIHK